MENTADIPSESPRTNLFRNALELSEAFYGESYDGARRRGILEVDPIALRRQNNTWIQIENSLAKTEQFRNRLGQEASRSPESGVVVLYRALLDRAVDNDGRRIYTTQLNEGRPVTDIIDEILNSGEYKERALRMVYQDLLRRNPDDDGKYWYIKDMNEGKSLEYVVDSIKSSSEYQEKIRRDEALEDIVDSPDFPEASRGREGDLRRGVAESRRSIEERLRRLGVRAAVIKRVIGGAGNAMRERPLYTAVAAVAIAGAVAVATYGERFFIPSESAPTPALGIERRVDTPTPLPSPTRNNLPPAASIDSRMPGTPVGVGRVAPEKPVEEIRGFGTFRTNAPSIYDVKNKNYVPYELTSFKLFPGKTIQLAGYGEGYTFRIQDREGKIYEVPIHEFNITSGSPVKEVRRLKNLGIRNNSPELMHFVPEIGASKVRIASDNEDFVSNIELKRALQAASEKNLNVMYVFNPSRMPTRAIVRNRMLQVLQFSNIELEIGNEPDETSNHYWEDFAKTNNFDSFAQFVKMSIEEADKIKPGVRIVVGALINPEKNQARLVQSLQKAGVDLKRVDFAVHAYSADEVIRNTQAVKKATGKEKVVITELGVDDEEDCVLMPELLDLSLVNGAEDIFIHELGTHENQWGYVRPGDKKKIPKFYGVQRWTQQKFERSGIMSPNVS